MTMQSQATPAGRKESKKSKQEPLPKDLKGTSRDPLEGNNFITMPDIETSLLIPETRQIFETLFQTEQFQDYKTKRDFLTQLISIAFSPNTALKVALFFAEIKDFLKDPHFVESLLELARIVDTSNNQICPIEGHEDFYLQMVREVVERASG